MIMDTRTPITRQAAKAACLTRYFTGKPCKYGHVAERTVSNGACTKCSAPRREKWKAANADNIAAAKAAWASANKDKVRLKSAKWRNKNVELRAAKQREYRKNNLEKETARQARWLADNPEKMSEINSLWYSKNLDKVHLRDSIRRARKINASARWDAELTEFAILEAYDLASLRATATGLSWHVDHMIPLQAKKACGLHVWSNLQVIPERLNLSKNNRMMLTLPGEWIRFA